MAEAAVQIDRVEAERQARALQRKEHAEYLKRLKKAHEEELLQARVVESPKLIVH